MTDFFICSIKSAQCTEIYENSNKKHSIAIFFCVLTYQKREISLLVGYKNWQEIGNDCDVSGLEASRKTDVSDIFLFSYQQRTFVPFLGELISSK